LVTARLFGVVEVSGWEAQVGARETPRTVLEVRVRQRRLSFEEFTQQLEVFARQSGEAGTLSFRHMQRLAAGQSRPDQLRPATVRLLERFFECPIEELLATPGAVEGAHHLPSDLFYEDPTPQKSPVVGELQAVLADYAGRSSIVGLTGEGEPASLKDIERDLTVAFLAYQQSRFTTVANRVSVLLVDAQRATRNCSGQEQVRAFGLLALSYQAAASVLTKTGEADLAWLAADRGLMAAEQSDSSAIRGSLVRSVAFALASIGQLEPAMRLIESGAQHLGPDVADDETAVSVYGTLFLAGAMAAARFGDGQKVASYLQEADGAARRLGRDANHLWTAFGPTNVAIHRVNTAAELGDMQTVLDLGRSLDTRAVPVERQVRHLLDVARAYSVIGRRDDALYTVLDAERMAPEQVRHHHLSRKIVLNLVQRSVGKPSVELGKLAQRVTVLAG
jgi:hypothetical protein